MTRVNIKRARPNLPTGGYGCTRPLAGLGCLCILLGALAISHWDNVYTVARVGAIILIVFGAVCVMPMLGLWTLKRWVRRFTANLGVRIKEVNASVVRDSQELYAGAFQYRPAVDSDFEGLDRDLFDRTTHELTDIGCRHLGDIVNVTMERTKNVRAVMRIMASVDGSSSIVIDHLPVDTAAGVKQSQPHLTINIDTEFLDSTFLCTSNSSAMTLKTLPAQLRMDLCPPEMPAAELMHRHEQELGKLKSSDPMITNTLAEVLALQQRKRALTVEFRKLIGFTDPA
jgi:hypothetical protein